jgi:hypothetical protein
MCISSIKYIHSSIVTSNRYPLTWRIISSQHLPCALILITNCVFCMLMFHFGLTCAAYLQYLQTWEGVYSLLRWANWVVFVMQGFFFFSWYRLQRSLICLNFSCIGQLLLNFDFSCKLLWSIFRSIFLQINWLQFQQLLVNCNLSRFCSPFSLKWQVAYCVRISGSLDVGWFLPFFSSGASLVLLLIGSWNLRWGADIPSWQQCTKWLSSRSTTGLFGTHNPFYSLESTYHGWSTEGSCWCNVSR